MADSDTNVVVKFREDTSTSVSYETAEALKERVGASSMEDLIHRALVNLINATEITYPPDDGFPTIQQFAAIARIAPQDIEVQLLSSLFNDFNEQKTCGSESQLEELLSGVTEENKHDLIDIRK